jgi:nicotinic acid mononucleotide adenylyltransferase
MDLDTIAALVSRLRSTEQLPMDGGPPTPDENLSPPPSPIAGEREKDEGSSKQPRLVFLRRAQARPAGHAGALLCLSASFNPMTTAHAALLAEGSRLIPPQETLLLLATANVDKPVEGLPLHRRLDLLLRFAESRSDTSVAMVGHGRFVDKLDAIRGAYLTDVRPVFLLGFDTLVRLFDEKYYTDRNASLSHLFRWSECIVANRAADTPSAVHAFLSRPDVSPFAHRIHPVRLPPLVSFVSATEVRARLARGECIADLVPPEIRSPLEAWWRDQRHT